MSVLSNSIQLGIFFMLLFTSYTSFSTIISQLYRQQGYKNLGKYAIFANYGTFMVSNMFAPYIGSKVNSKWLMLIAGCCYTFNCLTGFIVTYVIKYQWLVYLIVIFGSTLAGGSASVLWVSQGNYMHLICERGNKQSQKGYYFGVFFRIYTISNILGGVATTFLLGFFPAKFYFLIIACISGSSVLFLFFFLEKVEGEQVESNKKAQKLSLLTEGDERLIQKDDTPTKKFDIFGVFKFYPTMKVMLPFIGVVGFVIGYYSTSLSYLIQQTLPSDSTVEQIRFRSGIGIIFLGVGEILGGYISGYNADRMNIKTIGGISVCIYFITCQLSAITDQTRNQIIVYFASFGWGMTHSYFQNWITIVCSRNYKGRLESFSISKQFHCFTLCIYQIILIVQNPSMTVILTIMTFLTVFCIIPLTLLKDPEDNKEALVLGDSGVKMQNI